jgi:hypothetical protein
VQKSAGNRPGAVRDALCPIAGRGDQCFLGAGDRVGPGCAWAGRLSASGEVLAMIMVPDLRSGPRVGSDVSGRTGVRLLVVVVVVLPCHFYYYFFVINIIF